MTGDGGAVAAHDELVVAEEVELRVADVAFGDGLAGGVLLRVAEEKHADEDERYIRDAKFDFIRNYELIMSGDCTTIARHEEVIAY